MSRQRLHHALVLVLACAAAPCAGACDALPDLRANECGNTVVENWEACDTFARDGSASGKATACGQPGTPAECRQSFGAKLQEVLIDRPKDQVSVFVIPASVPWSSLWLAEAQDRLKSLRSESKFASLVFVADPMTLWRLLDDDKALESGELHRGCLCCNGARRFCVTG